MVLWLTVAVLYGLIVGSFLNVVIYRLPRGGSLMVPAWSYCPRCEHRLGALDLFPVFSFLLLGAKCRYCRAPISWRYPSIEMLTALLFGAVAWRFAGDWLDTVFGCLFVATLICVFFIDLEHFVIPDGLHVFGSLIGFAHNGLAIALGRSGQWATVGSRIIPASVFGFFGYAAVVYGIGLLSYVWIVSVLEKRYSVGRAGWDYLRDNALDWWYLTLYYLGALIPPLRRYAIEAFGEMEPLVGTTAEEIEADEDAGGMGGGDGKLAAAIGANLFWPLAINSFGLAVALGATYGVIILIRQRRRLGQRTHVPFGPSMAGGALIVLFFGFGLTTLLSTWYIHHFLSYPGSPFMTGR